METSYLKVSGKELHKAIFNRDTEIVKYLLQNDVDVNVKCNGTPVLHLALHAIALPDGQAFGKEIFRLLMQCPSCDITAKDDQGFSILHVASEMNLSDEVQLILDIKGDEESPLSAQLIDAKDRIGHRPLHKCAIKDSEDVAILLLTAGADVCVTTMFGVTPLHLAGTYGSKLVWSALVEAGADLEAVDCWGRTPVDVARKNGFTVDESGELAHSKTGHGTAIVTHDMCRKHYTCKPSETHTMNAPPENVHRLGVLLDDTAGVLRSKDLADMLIWDTDPKPATMSDILRIHEWSYVRNIQQVCEVLNKDAEGDNGIGFLDADTTLSRHSYDAALCAAGSVCRAVDKVMTGVVRNAFCPIRPPGHHAGPRGLVKGNNEGSGDSHGFCLFNNISVASSYAMNMYRDTVKKVAIVDFDVHHGNGTEETVRWLKPGVESSSFGCGGGYGIMQSPYFKPWFDVNDANNVLFVSVHGFGPRERPEPGIPPYVTLPSFYPGSGRTIIPDIPEPLGHEAHQTSPEVAGTVEDQAVVSAPKRYAEMTVHRGDDAGSGDDEEDDDDDDEDDGDYDEGSVPSISTEGDEAESGSRGDIQKFVKKMKMYTQVPSVSNNEGATCDPLILDVGVGLPELFEDEGGGMNANSSLYRHQWRNYFRDHIFPRLMMFKPDMIFISAGFDAHKKDLINSGYIALVEEDYEWVTRNLVRIANSCCNGRVVSALEGGYQIKGEYCSAFAKSVKVHVSSLAHGAQSSETYEQDDCDREKQIEKQAIDLAEAKRLAKIEEQRRREEEEYLQRVQALEAEAQANAAVLAAQEQAALSSDAPKEVGSVEGTRKRRRGNVDYAALSAQLFGGSADTSELVSSSGIDALQAE